MIAEEDLDLFQAADDPATALRLLQAALPDTAQADVLACGDFALTVVLLQEFAELSAPR